MVCILDGAVQPLISGKKTVKALELEVGRHKAQNLKLKVQGTRHNLKPKYILGGKHARDTFHLILTLFLQDSVISKAVFFLRKHICYLNQAYNTG